MMRMAPVRVRVDGRRDYYRPATAGPDTLTLGLIVWASLFGLSIIAGLL